MMNYVSIIRRMVFSSLDSWLDKTNFAEEIGFKFFLEPKITQTLHALHAKYSERMVLWHELNTR